MPESEARTMWSKTREWYQSEDGRSGMSRDSLSLREPKKERTGRRVG
jgi:hypothetical protein